MYKPMSADTVGLLMLLAVLVALALTDVLAHLA